MNAYLIRIRGLRDEPTLWAVRWQLFIHHEISDVVRGVQPETVAVLYRDEADPEAWIATLREAGYSADPIGAADEAGTAA